MSVNLKNKDKPSVSILGACILRDAFGTGKQFGDYTVKQFIQSNSIFSQFCPPLSELTSAPVLPEDMSATAPCWYKWFLINAKKSLFEELSSNKSDWLIFNLTEVQDMLLRVENEEGKVTFLDFCAGIKKNNLFENPKFVALKTKAVSPFEFDNTGGGITI